MVWLKRDSLTPAPRRPLLPRGPVAPPLTANPPAPDVLTKLRRLLEEGRFPEGAKLPPERALALELGVGRPALREAIKVLIGLGVLESRRGSGTYRRAAGQSPELAQFAGSSMPELGVLDLLEARKILEPKAAWLAATRASEKQLLAIEQAWRRLEMHDRDWKVAAKLDYELHAAIFRAANNPVLQLMNEFLSARLLGDASALPRFAPDAQAMRAGHGAIVEAILKRQADVAEKAMIDHLHTAGMNLIREAKR